MGRITKYSTIIRDYIKKYERPNGSTETYLITDLQHHHYQVLRMGWTDPDTFLLRIILYFQIKTDGKVWVLANWTEDEVEQILVEKGIKKSDIVLGLLPEYVRSHSGFAAA
jgi:XisI protein